ncbi:MAG: DUF4012 domain-containing protein [bacterium]
MAYRVIFSQMFDVRPRTSAGDLDFEKIKQIETVLNLRRNDLRQDQRELAERIINLESEQAGRGLETKKIRAKRQPKKNWRVVREKIPVLWPGISQVNLRDNQIETNMPDVQEILSALEAIEAADQLLKTGESEEVVLTSETDGVTPELSDDNVTELNYSIPIRKIVAPEEQFLDWGPLSDEATESQEKIEEELVSETPEAGIPWRPEFLSVGQEPEFSLANYESERARTLEEDFWLKPKQSEVNAAREDYLGVPEFSFARPKTRQIFAWRDRRKPLIIFAAVAVLIFSFVPALNWVNNAFSAKAGAMNSGIVAYEALVLAKDSLERSDFSGAQNYFSEAQNNFAAANLQIKSVGSWLLLALEKIPGLSSLSSKVRLVRVGEEMSRAGEEFSQMIGLFKKSGIGALSSMPNKNGEPLADILSQARDHLVSGTNSLISAKQGLEKIDISSLPSEMQSQLTLLSDKLPELTSAAASAVDWSDKLLKIIGNESAKKYLLIFQNNAEARATGGFIGTYGVLDLDQGQVKNLFIDGIFNPDGQLREKIVPPRPIQKISTAWSTHDANWFADFPTSAQKIMWFFEKTGGPTTDGVISLTPTVIERLLNVTGPIEMPEYGVTLNSGNFVEVTQYKVESDYDRELNQPKKILADFAPKFIDRISEEIKRNNFEILKVVNQALAEKHILIYFNDSDLEEFVQGQGWGGEIKNSDKDYLSIVNTNINGYKTDRVVDENVKYSSEIQDDGSIIDTVEITRHHQGGAFAYDWFNKVNADYMRVYVPKGSELLSAQGQTKEEYKPPIDYQAAGFKTDQDVAAQVDSFKKDVASGTDIFEESGKTVFGNWVYVSPGETVKVTYKYRLPFKLDIARGSVNFSLLVQKQSGSGGGGLDIQVSWPKSWKTIWSSVPESESGNAAAFKTDLRIDRAAGFAFSSAP